MTTNETSYLTKYTQMLTASVTAVVHWANRDLSRQGLEGTGKRNLGNRGLGWRWTGARGELWGGLRQQGQTRGTGADWGNRGRLGQKEQNPTTALKNSCSCLSWMNLSRASSCFARSSALFMIAETPELRDPADFELECFDPAVYTLECFDPADFTLECFEAETMDRNTGLSANKSAISVAATPCCSSQVRTRWSNSALWQRRLVTKPNRMFFSWLPALLSKPMLHLSISLNLKKWGDTSSLSPNKLRPWLVLVQVSVRSKQRP